MRSITFFASLRRKGRSGVGGWMKLQQHARVRGHLVLPSRRESKALTVSGGDGRGRGGGGGVGGGVGGGGGGGGDGGGCIAEGLITG